MDGPNIASFNRDKPSLEHTSRSIETPWKNPLPNFKFNMNTEDEIVIFEEGNKNDLKLIKLKDYVTKKS